MAGGRLLGRVVVGASLVLAACSDTHVSTTSEAREYETEQAAGVLHLPPPVLPTIDPTIPVTASDTLPATSPAPESAAPTEPTTAAPTSSEAPAVVPRAIPSVPLTPPLSIDLPWAGVTSTTPSGRLSVDVGCAAGTDAGNLAAFFAERIGPMLGGDYQHVYPLGGDRYLWLFQDVFVDHTGLASRLDSAAFVHNAALVQRGACFSLLTQGTPAAPTSFEQGNGERRLTRWFWPMGGELTPSGLQVFWVEMAKDADPGPGDGLGWHPARTWLATYDPVTLARRSFELPPDSGTSPVYGYAVATDDSYTYLFGNTFEQNLDREGGYASGPHSATAVYLARVPRLSLGAAPEYYAAGEWSTDPSTATAISSRYWVENPMQPRRIDGVWVAATKVDGYWGERLAIDVAPEPWGPWTDAGTVWLQPRDGDPLMNTYHAHLMPWRDAGGALVVSVSQNARDMVRDAFPHPSRYRIGFLAMPWATPPPAETTTTAPTTTTSLVAVPVTELDVTTTTAATTTAAATTVAETTTTAADTTTASPPSSG